VSAERRVQDGRPEAVARDRSEARPVRDHRTGSSEPRDHREVRDHREADRRYVRDSGERPTHTVTVRSRDYSHLPGILRLAAILGDKVDAAERDVERKAEAIGEGEASSGDAIEAQAAAEQLRILSSVATQAVSAEGEAFRTPLQR
jgi:hypothetical protein